jgi:hypothetical protein
VPPAQLAPDFLGKPRFPILVRPLAASDALARPAGQIQVLRHLRQVRRRRRVRPEMRDEQRRGLHRPIRARLSRHSSRSMSGGGVGGSTNPRSARRMPAGVADERHAAVGVVVADVMRRMSRRIRDVEIPGRRR